MSAPGLKPYEFSPYLLPPVFEGAPLPLREFQIETILSDSLMSTASWPPDLEPNAGKTVQDAVREFEQSDEPIDVKDARIIGILAATRELELSDNLTMRAWKLAPHLSMLNAVGAALSAGLMVSESSLRMAAAFHIEHSSYELSADDPYASPGADPIIESVKRTMAMYSSLDEGDMKGTGHYLSYSLDSIGYELPMLPPGQEVLESYAEAEEAQPMLGLYNYILGQIHATCQGLLDREEELRIFLEQRYAFNERIQREYEEGARSQDAPVETLPGF